MEQKKGEIDCIEHLLGSMFCECSKCKAKRKKRNDRKRNDRRMGGQNGH